MSAQDPAESILSLLSWFDSQRPVCNHCRLDLPAKIDYSPWCLDCYEVVMGDWRAKDIQDKLQQDPPPPVQRSTGYYVAKQTNGTLVHVPLIMDWKSGDVEQDESILKEWRTA